ncbi:hypothetical protein MRX96_036221 [Rhipicephalus microplus]
MLPPGDCGIKAPLFYAVAMLGHAGFHPHISRLAAGSSRTTLSGAGIVVRRQQQPDERRSARRHRPRATFASHGRLDSAWRWRVRHVRTGSFHRITDFRINLAILLTFLACTADTSDAPSSHKGGGRPPRITEQPVDVVVRKHEPVTLRCGTDGEPPPRIAWFHDGKSVRDSATRMVLPEGQLFFLQVQHSRREQDTGLYWCTATNPLGTARSRNASVELAGNV